MNANFDVGRRFNVIRVIDSNFQINTIIKQLNNLDDCIISSTSIVRTNWYVGIKTNQLNSWKSVDISIGREFSVIQSFYE